MESWKGKTAEKCSRGFMTGQNSHMKVVKEKTGWKWMQVNAAVGIIDCTIGIGGEQELKTAACAHV